MSPPNLHFENQKKPAHRRLRTPLYASPFVERLMEEDGYSPAQREIVREFRDRGIIKIRLARPDFDRLAKEIIAQAGRLYNGAPRCMDGWRRSRSIQELACDPEVAQTLKLLYGRAAIPMQTLNFPRGSEQPTHTDTVHFSSQPMNFMCGVWVALEPITAFNGPLHYYPGSHNLPIIDYDDLGVLASGALWSENHEYHQELLRELIDSMKFNKEILLAERGEAIIWAANLLHGGEPIGDPSSSRHSQVTHYYFDGPSYYTPSLSNTHMNKFHRPNRLDIRTGKPIPHYYEELRLPWTPSN